MDEDREKIAPTVSIETVIVVRPMKVWIFVFLISFLPVIARIYACQPGNLNVS